ncbi:hypothetical protein FGD71_042000 [Streptomyces sporangiiformans]|uniref:Uncharacterized protein n=1 Tax=Streptomyces sporangiiformans TaxID=2315329 RepID=A0A505D1A4_9ACTN|nr:hypothetical protein FGD71_042000 [Streptomyces sporangiiformans]
MTRCLRTSDEQRPSPIDGNRTAVHRRRGPGRCQRINVSSDLDHAKEAAGPVRAHPERLAIPAAAP